MTLERIATTREEAHEAVVAGYALAKLLLADGKRVRVTVEEDQDTLSAKQRRFLHGIVLKQVSEQVRGAGGERHVLRIWKEYFRDLFLGSEWKTVALPNGQRSAPFEVRCSTEDLGVKDYSEYIDKVIAHATTECGVQFHFRAFEREEVRYQPKATTKERETC